MINLICSRIYDAFDKKFHVFLLIILLLVIDCLDSPAKLYCSTDFLKYWDKLIYHQISVSDLLHASFQLTAFDF